MGNGAKGKGGGEGAMTDVERKDILSNGALSNRDKA